MSSEQTQPILFLAFANDRQDGTRYLRNLPEEARRLQEILDTAVRANLCEIIVRQNVTAAEVFNIFQDDRVCGRIALFHFGGHANGYQLLLESTAGEAAAADSGGLATFLGEQNGLRLVFLNGCSTQRQVQGLLHAGVDAVIATAQAINDSVATDFAARFYRGLASGSTVESAFKQAAGTIQTQHGDDLRHLYLGSKEGEKDNPAALLADRLPWDIYYREGAEQIAGWNLPDAANDPLAALPPLPAMDLPERPFRHLHWFRREDAPIFFGRGYQIRDLYGRVIDAADAPIILFYGQSGVGKSSLLAAGLLPRLEASHAISYTRREQEAGLRGALEEALRVSEGAPSLGDAWRTREAELDKPLIVILDQVEEIYTRPNEDNPNELADFLDALHAIFGERNARPGGKLILGFRKEWLAEIEKQLADRSLPRGKVFLQRLDQRGIIEAVTGVARDERLQAHYGLTVADHLPVEIADDLLSDRGSAIAPTLQILLSKLWERAKASDYDHLSFDDDLYHELRQEGLGLDDFLDNQLAALRQQRPDAVNSGLALDLLAFHTTKLGTSGERALAELRESYRHHDTTLPDLLRDFQNLYLLVESAQNQPDAEPRSRLAHDTLARLVGVRYEESDAPGQRARRILENRIVDWVDGQTGTALDDADLTLVEAGISGTRVLSEDEQRLVDISVRQRAARRAAERQLAEEREAAQQRELMLEKRANRWLRAAVGVLAAAALILLTVLIRPALVAWQTRGPLVPISAGVAIIGTDAADAKSDEQPEVRIPLDAYAIEQYEVSNRQYQRCVDVGRCDALPNVLTTANTEFQELPVTHVTAIQAAKYCRWVGRRLPTELEWERAARGADGATWPWGSEPPTRERVQMPINDYWPEGSTVVDSLESGTTRNGEIHHLIGNVWEWTSTFYTEQTYDDYDAEQVWDGQAASLSNDDTLVLRGGGWSSDIFSVTEKYWLSPEYTSNDTGIRCAKDK